MNELRQKDAQNITTSKKGKRKHSSTQNKNDDSWNTLFEEDIFGPRKKSKASYDERLASVQKGREDRPAFRSALGKKNKQTPSSSTNKEKMRNKPIMMILSSGQVRNKKRASLFDKQKKLRAHIDRAKKAHH